MCVARSFPACVMRDPDVCLLRIEAFTAELWDGPASADGRSSCSASGDFAVRRHRSLVNSTASETTVSPRPEALALASVSNDEARKSASGPHGSPSDAKHRPQTRKGALLTMRSYDAVVLTDAAPAYCSEALEPD